MAQKWDISNKFPGTHFENCCLVPTLALRRRQDRIEAVWDKDRSRWWLRPMAVVQMGQDESELREMEHEDGGEGRSRI